MASKWNVYEDRQGAMMTTLIRDEAKLAGFQVDYSRIGWTTIVAVFCTVEQWAALLDVAERWDAFRAHEMEAVMSGGSVDSPSDWGL